MSHEKKRTGPFFYEREFISPLVLRHLNSGPCSSLNMLPRIFLDPP
jgi:hypothetical protein